MTVLAVVGAQYGSEGKGAIVAKIAREFDVHVRTGAPNAGHSYYVDDAQTDERVKVIARSLPVGASNPDATLVLGRAAVIDLDLLLTEIQELEKLGFRPRSRIFADGKALVLNSEWHHKQEGGVEGEAHRLIGSTGEGVGPVRMAHMARTTYADMKIEHIGDDGPRSLLESYGVTVVDTSDLLDKAVMAGAKILLEGTQGSGLSLTHGEWPYVTSNDTNAGQMCVDAGISPLTLTDVLLVARTFPIRVAGNSGPLEGETTFKAIGVPEERTTVTKKVRRVGRWDQALFERAVRLNGPDPMVALTFADYLQPSIFGQTEPEGIERNGPLDDLLRRIEAVAQVQYIGTGPDSVIKLEGARW